MSKKTVIFDLDGTLADITSRRELSIKDNGKMDWDTFFNPKFISLDDPNTPVIKMTQIFDSQGFRVLIFSGRSDRTLDATMDWLVKHNVPFDDLIMRPKKHHFMKDSDLKQMWLDDSDIVDKDDIFAVFDDRNQVVDMWRDNGLTVFQVAEGNF
jgi:hypothetical protein